VFIILLRDFIQFYNAIGTVQVVGNQEEIASSESIKKLLAVKTGEDYSIMVIMGDARRVTRLYGDKGYAFTRVSHNEKFDFDNRRVNITYNIVEGNLYHIQDIQILGNKRTKMQVILREIEITKNERFNYTKLMNAQNDLNRLGLFGKVTITKRPGSGPDLVVIVVEVEEASTGAFEVMLSYDEYNGLAGTVVLKQKNFDVLGMWSGHFTGAAHEVSLQYFASPKTKDLSFSIYNPRVFDGKNNFTYKISDRVMEFSEYSEDAETTYFSLGRELMKNFRMSLGFNVKNLEIFDVSGGAPQVIQDEVGVSKVRSIKIAGSFNRLQYHIPSFPGGGYRMGGSLEYAGDFLNATREYVSVAGSYHMYRTLSEKADGSRTIWSMRISGKAANELGDETAVPLSERSALGGIRTVRGYDWYSIGPYVDGDNVRGDAQMLFTTELMFPLKWDPVRRRNLIHGVIFYDAALRTEIVEGHELYCDEVMQMFLFMERTEKGKNGRAKEAERRDV